MDKKFLAAVAVCIVSLTAVAAGTIYLGQKGASFRTSDAEIGKTTEDNRKAAQDIVKQFESEIASEGDRVGLQDEDLLPKDKEEKNVHANGEVKESVTKRKIVDANKENGGKINEDYRGLSSEATAQIATLSFGKKSSLLWPVEGNIIIPFDMESTVYFATLDEYKTSPGIVIQSSRGVAIKAATTGVITKIEESEELGVCISQAIGNDYIATYGQITNPEVAAGDYVEAGQVIGYVAKPTAYYKQEGDNLYFSLSRKGKNIDPLKHIVYED
ncbi:MAG: M23 family metallopeptidase [Eubacterium sp.]|nr:M23 family metallopeptidase [Eubacterium sp.]